MGSPSICVTLVVVIFNEPFGIGVAVMNEVPDGEVEELAVADVPKASLLSALGDVLTSLPLTEEDGFEGKTLGDSSLVGRGVAWDVAGPAAIAAELDA